MLKDNLVQLRKLNSLTQEKKEARTKEEESDSDDKQ